MEKENMIGILIANDEIVKQSINLIVKLQSQNSNIYNNTDFQIFSNFIEQLNKGEELTKNQMFIARKRILKYTPQLVNIINKSS